MEDNSLSKNELVSLYAKAKSDDINALIQLGFYYVSDEDPEEGLVWLRKAVASDKSKANDIATHLLELNKGAEAVEFYKIAAEDGNLGSMSNLAMLLKQSGKRDQAENWYMIAAHQGYVVAIHNLGVLYLETEENVEKGIEWLTKAAKQGHKEAWMTLGEYYSTHDQPDKALEYFNFALNQGDKRAITYIAEIMMEKGQEEEAIELLEESWKEGDKEAISTLGFLYWSLGNVTKAQELFEIGIEEENELCIFNMGSLLLEEFEDKDGARTYFLRASEMGNPFAMFNLGVLELEEENLEQAEIWLEKSAQEGFREAMLALANLYEFQGKDEASKEWKVKADLVHSHQ